MKKLTFLIWIVSIGFVFNLQVNGQEGKMDGPVFKIVEDMPEFPGGEEAFQKFISGNIKYPVIAQKNGIQGKVYVSFVITKDGDLKNAKIIRGVDPSLDKETLRVINESPKWKPGKQRGQNVNVEFTIPVIFSLDNSKMNQNEVISEGEPLFYVVEEAPEFPGGEDALRKFVSENVKYPDIAKKNGIQGKVFVSFTVSRDGKIKDAKIERGVDPSLDKEALRIINEMPLWKPGKQRGQNVNVKCTVPVNFVLDGPPMIKEKLKQ